MNELPKNSMEYRIAELEAKYDRLEIVSNKTINTVSSMAVVVRQIWEVVKKCSCSK